MCFYDAQKKPLSFEIGTRGTARGASRHSGVGGPGIEMWVSGIEKKKHKEARVMSGLCFFEKGCVVGDSRRKDVVAFACKIEFRYICRFK
jgi:hypothetical protein